MDSVPQPRILPHLNDISDIVLSLYDLQREFRGIEEQLSFYWKKAGGRDSLCDQLYRTDDRELLEALQELRLAPQDQHVVDLPVLL